MNKKIGIWLIALSLIFAYSIPLNADAAGVSGGTMTGIDNALVTVTLKEDLGGINFAKGTPGGNTATESTEDTTDEPDNPSNPDKNPNTPGIKKPEPPVIESPDGKTPGVQEPTEAPSSEDGSTEAESSEDTEKTTTENDTEEDTSTESGDDKTDTEEETTVAVLIATGDDASRDGGNTAEGKGFPLTALIIGACALIIVAAVIVVIIAISRGKKKDTSEQTLSPDVPPNDFDDTVPPIPPAFAAGAAEASSELGPEPEPRPLKLEVYNGAAEDRTLYIKRELIIGSAPDCDIVINEGYVAPKNTRISVVNGVICIEDLGSSAGTHVAGLRVRNAVPLRSGDVISIGEAEFCLIF